MTEKDLLEIAGEALSQSKRNDWKCVGAGIIQFQANELIPGTGEDRKEFAWFGFRDGSPEPRLVDFRLQFDDASWVRDELAKRLVTGETRISGEIEIGGAVSGVVVGVNTGVIQKNSYGGDIYNQVQVYVLNEEGRKASGLKLLGENPVPYKFLSPYTARDELVFKGRDKDICIVADLILAQRLLVVHGGAGVGKTSLLAAGVIPKLIRDGAMVIQVQDYARPVDAIRDALLTNAERIKIVEEPTLAGLIKAVTDATGGTLVLVFDQFERLFENSVNNVQRESFVADLVESLTSISEKYLRVFILIRDEAQPRLWDLQERLPELLRCQHQLLPLDDEQAIEAITGPLRVLNSRVSFYPDVVKSLIVPDLRELNVNGDSLHVYPTYLQIVCDWLYKQALNADPPVVDKNLYLENGKGADGILASYIEATLGQLEESNKLASRLMTLMITPGVARWLKPLELRALLPEPTESTDEKISVAAIGKTLDELVAAGLLVRRDVSEQEYTITSPTIAQEVLRLAGPEAEQRDRAESELERAWLSWLARGVWATREQLRYLAAFGSHLAPRPVKTLFLLRSAVERGAPVRPWLSRLEDGGDRNLLRQLEGLRLEDGAEADGVSTLNKAAALVGLARNGAESGATSDAESFGPLALNAVTSADAAVRQTCALAVATIYDDKPVALGRLERALAVTKKGLTLRLRRAELLGVLADTDPKIEAACASLSLDNILVWRWRAARRVARDQRRRIYFTVGGALGAGVSLGVLRAAIAAIAPTPQFPGIQFGLMFYFGAILGGALALGSSLAEPLLLSPSRSEGSSGEKESRASTSMMAVVLGAAFFGTAHLVVAWINGLSPTRLPSVVLMGFAAGLFLSMALYGESRASRLSGVVAWLTKLGIAASGFALIEFYFERNQESGEGIAIGWHNAFYSSAFSKYFTGGRATPSESYWSWPNLMGLFDAALIGIVLTVGLTIGLRQARRLLRDRRSPSTHGSK